MSGRASQVRRRVRGFTTSDLAPSSFEVPSANPRPAAQPCPGAATAASRRRCSTQEMPPPGVADTADASVPDASPADAPVPRGPRRAVYRFRSTRPAKGNAVRVARLALAAAIGHDVEVGAGRCLPRVVAVPTRRCQPPQVDRDSDGDQDCNRAGTNENRHRASS